MYVLRSFSILNRAASSISVFWAINVAASAAVTLDGPAEALLGLRVADMVSGRSGCLDAENS